MVTIIKSSLQNKHKKTKVNLIQKKESEVKKTKRKKAPVYKKKRTNSDTIITSLREKYGAGVEEKKEENEKLLQTLKKN